MTQPSPQPLYLVTGVAGNLGSSIAARLLADGHDVRGLVLAGDPAAAGTRAAAIVTVAAGFSQKVHDVNVTGTQNVIDACLDHRVRKLVYVGSTGAIAESPAGTPITEPDRFDPAGVVGYYAWTKAAASQLVLDAVRGRGLDATLVYPTGIAGPDDYAFGPVARFVIDYCEGRLRAGIAGSFNAVDVRDLAEATLTAATRGRTGEGYILGNECVSMAEMFGLLSELTHTRRVTTVLPAGAGRVLGRLSDLAGRFLGSSPRLTSFAVYNLTRNNEFDSAKARRELGFQTRPFAETLADTIAWLEREGRITIRAA